MKKNLAIVLGTTGNQAFAVGNVLLGLNRHSPGWADETILFHHGISPNDQSVLNGISPCRFIDYAPTRQAALSEGELARFSHLSAARFDCFNLLNEFHNVIWLDSDVLIQGDIRGILNGCRGIAMARETTRLRRHFRDAAADVFSRYDLTRHTCNAGVLVLSDQLPGFDRLTPWCYQTMQALSAHLRTPDQEVLNLMLQEFSLPLTELDGSVYNCRPLAPARPSARIIHAVGREKFWNFYHFRQWNENHREWLRRGGSDHDQTRASLPNGFKYPRKFFFHGYFKLRRPEW